MNKEEYNKLLQDPRWKAKREEILERDGHKCTNCRCTSGLQVHHIVYEGDIAPWEYKDEDLITLCSGCHKIYHKNNRNAYRAYSVSYTTEETYEAVDKIIKFENKVKVISSKAILNLLVESINSGEKDFISPAVKNILSDIVELFYRGFSSNVVISSSFKGDIEGTIDIKFTYGKPSRKRVLKTGRKKVK